MNILAIGNSFSQDATRYLHGVARSDGFELNVVNLYIGGCPLSTHFRNAMNEKACYELQVNGVNTGFNVSIKDALLNREWDIVVMQQVSKLSVNYETYQPYLNEISAYVKKYAPKAKQFIHQTWAYEKDSKRLCEELGYKEQRDMFNDLKIAYDKAKNDIDADGIILSGEVFQKLLENGIESVHRDTFHAKLGLGRYALSLAWYKTLTNRNINNIVFNDFDEEVSEKEIEIIKKSVNEVVL